MIQARPPAIFPKLRRVNKVRCSLQSMNHHARRRSATAPSRQEGDAPGLSPDSTDSPQASSQRQPPGGRRAAVSGRPPWDRVRGRDLMRAKARGERGFSAPLCTLAALKLPRGRGAEGRTARWRPRTGRAAV
ncbi:hypothetical protein BCR34DRAFT_593586 [Clohesyomyces aquaticus]|uniref:Uncharacterized protein n=1 Tax=Clohesyomyces aquaticus TaxID=1231657 RepID=A0A1Y1YGU1_9PLEO|nr:hypothetical protein BCR34DRAFT_593586 [Clohesyomyces aquaticus]